MSSVRIEGEKGATSVLMLSQPMSLSTYEIENLRQNSDILKHHRRQQHVKSTRRCKLDMFKAIIIGLGKDLRIC
jgi:hypothetical protein